MTSKTQSPSWQPYISKAILEAKEIPLMPFLEISKEKLEHALDDVLKIPDLKLELDEFKFREKETFISLMGKDPKVFAFTLPPLEGITYLILNSEDFKKILSLSLGFEIQSIDDHILKAYEDFFLAKIMQSIEDSGELKEVGLKFSKENLLPEGPCLVMEGIIKTKKANFPFCLAVSAQLRISLKEHQAKISSKPSSIPPHIPIDLGCSVGHVHMSLGEWQKVSLGDFIIIDSMGFNPNDKEGNLILSYKKNILFYAHLSNNKIKISQNSMPSREKDSMTNEKGNKEEGNEEHNDEGFFLGEDEDFFKEDDELKNLLKQEQEKRQEAQELPNENSDSHGTQEVFQETSKAQSQKVITPDNIPLNIRIEVGHLSITAKDLLQIQPGNEFTLGKDVDGHVDLVVSGALIAKGELIKIGDVLGVRILSL
jgi:flagellar motor switch protein FliN/FliY